MTDPAQIVVPRLLDFRTGQNGWSHALHASTWRSLGRPERAWWDVFAKRRDSKANARRHSFMCHVQGDVQQGMRVVWSAEGGDVFGTVVGIEPCSNPRDMYTLTVEVKI